MNLRTKLAAILLATFGSLASQAAIEINWTISGAVLLDGSTSDAPNVIPAGSLIQLIWAGPDDLANPPNSAAGPDFTSGDDVILSVTNFLTPGGFSQPTIQREYPIPGSSLADQTFIFARVFNVADPSSGTCQYYDTPLLAAQEQTATDAINADPLDITSPFDFRTTQGSVPVVVTDLTCSDNPSQCASLDIQSTDDDGTGTGTATVTAMGIGPFRYAWDAAAGGQTTPTATSLAEGSYTVVVTDIGNGSCTVTGSVAVAAGLGFTLNVTPTPCPSANGGVAEVQNITGAAGTTMVNWAVPASATINGNIASDLPPGSYSVTVTDGGANSVEQTFEITATFANIDFIVTGTDPECGTPLGGSATISTISGGSGTYVIQWDAAASSQTSQTATGLAAGTYSVTVSDTSAPGCGVTKQVTLATDGEAPTITCTSSLAIDDCPDNASTFDPVARRLAVDAAGNALAPAGLAVVTDNRPCSLVVDYTFALTNDCAVSTCISRVTFTAVAPVIDTVPASLQDQVLACQATLPLPNTNDLAMVFSGCGDITINIEQVNPSSACRSNMDPAQYIYTATDTCGGSAVLTQNFTWVADTTAPTVDPIQPREIAGCSDVPAVDSSVVTADDDCNAPATVTLGGDSTTILADGRTELTRTWNVADACGNMTTVDEVITFVNDTSMPVFANLPQNFAVTIPADDDCSFVVPDFINSPPAGFNPITFSDGANGVTVTQSVAAGTVITSPGTLTVIVTARNSCGNQSTSAINLSLTCGSADPGSISGSLYTDRNANGRLDASRPDELPLPGVVVYIDANNNGMLDDFETSVTTDSSGAFTFADLAPGVYRIRAVNPAGFSLTAPLSGFHLVNLASAQNVTGIEFGAQGVQQLTGTAWQDINMNGTPDENLSTAGIGGVTVNLYIVKDGSRSLISAATTSASGEYTFRNLAPGFTYEVEIVESTINAEGSVVENNQNFVFEEANGGGAGDTFDIIASDAAGTPITGTASTPGAFALEVVATAIELARFEAIGDVITWETAWEQYTLGFFIVRQVGDAAPERVHDNLILPTGAANGAVYSITDPNPPAAGEAAVYFLQEVETNLEVNEYGPYPLVHAAAPQGEPVRVVSTDGANVSFTTDADNLSYLVIGLDDTVKLQDVTDAENPIQLKGEELETDSGTGIYFSWPADRSIEAR